MRSIWKRNELETQSRYNKVNTNNKNGENCFLDGLGLGLGN